MATLLLTFANSETHPLDSLRKEDDKAHAVLGERVARGDFTFAVERLRTRRRIFSGLCPPMHSKAVC